jgi:uncharacterized protein YdaU (DUF1376 family)
MEWYPWYPTDFQNDTWHLSLAEEGAYRRLIDEYMRRRGPLPDDNRALAAIVRVGLEEWSVIAPVVRKFFRARDGNLSHKRCQQEILAQNTRLEGYSERGKKAAFARYSKSNKLDASCMLVPATLTLRKGSSLTSSEHAVASEEASEKTGVATPELAKTIKQKGWA